MEERSLETLGQRLRSGRENKGRTLQDIAAVTRVPLHVLEALEAGDFSRMPAPIFVRGFIQAYAREVGLDKGELLEEYRALQPPVTQEIAVPITARGFEKRGGVAWVLFQVLLGFLLLAALAGAGYYYYYFLESRQPTTQPSLATAPPSRPEVRPEPAPAPPPTPPAPLEEEEALAAVEAPVVEPLVLAEEEPEAGPAPRPGHELKAVFHQKTWIRIVIDGERVEDYLFEPGMSRTWRAEEGFRLRVGNAGGLRLFFDGEALPSLGIPGQVVDLKLPRAPGNQP